MKIVGVTGPPGAGKSTLWRAVCGSEAKGDIAAVGVPDERLETLARLHSSRKKVPARIEVVDVHASAKTAQAALARLRDLDALLLVLPCFGGLDGQLELEKIKDDFILADMAPVETRLRRARKDLTAKKEVPSLEAAMHHLEIGEFMRSKQWDRADLGVFSPLALITLKPLIVVYNVDEEGLTNPLPDSGFASFAASASLEAEVSGMPQEEAAGLLSAYGIEEPVLGRVIQAVYQSLDLITFFTTGDDESRAWELKKGATAPEAAGAIHSDLQRGFIRAEVASYDQIKQAGSWDAAKSQGLTRVEGKDYVFKEGDVTHFRFAV